MTVDSPTVRQSGSHFTPRLSILIFRKKMDIFQLCYFIIFLITVVDARCKHHVTCPECVSDSNCQWSLFSAVYESSSKQVRSNECHASPTTFHGRTAKQFPVRPGSDELSPPISWAKNVMECLPLLRKNNTKLYEDFPFSTRYQC